jgi:hypothetical protein
MLGFQIVERLALPGFSYGTLTAGDLGTEAVLTSLGLAIYTSNLIEATTSPASFLFNSPPAFAQLTISLGPGFATWQQVLAVLDTTNNNDWNRGWNTMAFLVRQAITLAMGGNLARGV